MGAASGKPGAGNSLLVHAHADSAGARDGALRLLQAVWSVGDAAVFYSVHYFVWDARGVYPDSVGDSLARGAVRYWDRRADCGISGGLGALPMLALSLGLSRLIPAGVPPPDIALGYPLIFYIVHGLRGMGTLPLMQLSLHPVTIAAWVGMFATSLNLLPGGQLDGGHIVFSLWPRAHRWVSRLTILALIPMAYFLWAGWLVWAVCC